MAAGWIEHDPPSRGRVAGGWLAAVSGVGLLVVIAWALAQVWRDDLPDPVAIHWGASGQADGSATLNATIAVTTWLGVAGVVLLLGVGAALLARPRLLRGWMTGLSAVSALAPTSLLMTLLPNLGASSWQESSIAGWHLVLIVVLPAALAALAWSAGARPARLSTLGPAIPAGAPVAITREPFAERQVLRGLVWAAGALLAMLVGFAVIGGAAVLGLGLPVAMVVVWLSVYRYRVTDDGVTLGFGPVGPLRREIGVDEIEGASVVQLRPAEWGGWGYRTTGNDWAVVLRKGPGCRIALAGNRSVSLTSDEGQALAGRVNVAVTRHWDRP